LIWAQSKKSKIVCVEMPDGVLDGRSNLGISKRLLGSKSGVTRQPLSEIGTPTAWVPAIIAACLGTPDFRARQLCVCSPGNTRPGPFPASNLQSQFTHFTGSLRSSLCATSEA